jgi:hypothetical protein
MFKDIIGDAALISSQPAGANIPANPNLQDLGFGDGVSQETSTASKDKKKKKKKSVNDHSKSVSFVISAPICSTILLIFYHSC